MFYKKLTGNSKAEQLTFGHQITQVFISPKEDKLLYPQEDHGDERHHLYVLPINQKKENPIKITEKPLVSWAIDWHPNGKEVSRSYAEGTNMGIETILLDSNQSFVFKRSQFGVLDLDYSHDGKWLACTASTEKGSEIQIFNRQDPDDVIIYSLKEDSRENSIQWSPNDNWVGFQTNANGNRHWIIQEFEGSEEIALEVQDQEEALYFNPCCWKPNGDGIYYVVSKHGRSFIREHSLNGEIKDDFPFPIGQIKTIKLNDNGSILLAYQSSMTSPAAIYKHIIGTEKSTVATPVNYNKNILNLLSKPQSVWFSSFDNRKIHGWYLKGTSENDEKIPGLIFIHGGPEDQVFDEWSQGVYLQSISNSGFGVFAVNYRGSTGYGSEFQNLNNGDIGGGDLEDVVYATEWLKQRPEIKSDKIGIVGASYGGFMTLYSLVRRPTLFSAGLALVPVTDWIQNHEHLIANRTDILFGGTPEEVRELYIERSPITYINDIQAPVMIVAGDRDSRCPIEPIRKFVNILEKKKHPYKYIEYSQSGHNIGLEDRSRRARDFFKMMRFLKKHLK